MQRTGKQPRVHVPNNSVYHVMMRGNNRQNIFYVEAYYHYFLKLLSDIAKKFDHKVLAYCLMTNHVHLMLHIKESSLSAIMQNVNFRYARWTNHHRKRIGHLFQACYAAIEVSNESYLIHLCRYILVALENAIHHCEELATKQNPWFSASPAAGASKQGESFSKE